MCAFRTLPHPATSRQFRTRFWNLRASHCPLNETPELWSVCSRGDRHADNGAKRAFAQLNGLLRTVRPAPAGRRSRGW